MYIKFKFKNKNFPNKQYFFMKAIVRNMPLITNSNISELTVIDFKPG